MKNLFLASRSSSPSVQKKEQARDVKVFLRGMILRFGREQVSKRSLRNVRQEIQEAVEEHGGLGFFQIFSGCIASGNREYF